MKNTKAFTLVELLGVIVILGILALITVPTVLNQIKSSKTSLYENQLANIRLALQNWKLDNEDLLPEEIDKIYLTIGQLKAENYLDNDLKNPVTGDMWPNDMQLTITNNNGYQYDILENTGTKTSVYNTSTPTITLDSGDIRTISLNSTYVAPVVTIHDKDGNTSVGSITPTITGTGTTINTSKGGVYYLTYKTTVNDIPIAFIQTVIIGATYANGTPVYYNPVTGSICTSSSAVSNIGTKTGCMKWYIFNDAVGASNINLLLDHNTTAVLAWNSSGSNTAGPSEALNQLFADTDSWAGVPTRNDSYNVSNGKAMYTINYANHKARLMTAKEIAEITKHPTFNEASSGTNFLLDTNTDKESNTCQDGDISGCKYGWLYDRTKLTCKTYGCLNNADIDVAGFGYWLSTAVAGNTTNAWGIGYNGGLYGVDASFNDHAGIRPVITIPKSLLQ